MYSIPVISQQRLCYMGSLLLIQISSMKVHPSLHLLKSTERCKQSHSKSTGKMPSMQLRRSTEIHLQKEDKVDQSNQNYQTGFYMLLSWQQKTMLSKLSNHLSQRRKRPLPLYSQSRLIKKGQRNKTISVSK